MGIRKSRGLFTVALLLLLPGMAIAANGMRDTGTSVRSISEGGAFIAVEPSPSALSGNPAALAFLDEPAIEVDVRAITDKTSYTGVLGGTASDRMLFAPNLSYGRRLGDRWAIGLGVFSLSDMSFEVQDFDLSHIGAPAGTFDSASSKVQFLALTPGLAYRIDDRTSIGLALNWSSGQTSDQAYSIFGSTVGQQLSGLSGEGYSLRAGLLHHCNDDTTLGAYWRGRSHMDVGGGTLVLAPGNPLGGGQKISGVAIDGADFPEEYGVGISHDFSCEFRGTAEYRRINWAAVRKDIVVSPPGLPPIVFPQDWKNQCIFVLGGQYMPQGDEDTIWRAGLNYGRSPVPDETLSPIFAATNEMHYSLGYERRVSDRLHLLTGMSYSPAHRQTSTATNPFNAQFGAGQPFSAGTAMLNFGVGLSWKLGQGKDLDCCCEGCSTSGDAPNQVCAESDSTSEEISVTTTPAAE